MKRLLVILITLLSVCLFFSCENAVDSGFDKDSVVNKTPETTEQELPEENKDETGSEIIGSHSFNFNITASPKTGETELPANFAFSHEIFYVQIQDNTGEGLEASLNIDFELPTELSIPEGKEPFAEGAQNITATIGNYTGDSKNKKDHVSLQFATEEEYTSEHTFTVENSSAQLDIAFNAMDFDQRGTIEIALDYDSTIYTKLPKKIIILAFSKGSLVQDVVTMTSIKESVENSANNVEFGTASEGIGWNLLIHDNLENVLQNDFNSTFELAFTGVRADYPIKLTSNSSNVSNIEEIGLNDLGNVVFGFDLKHSKLEKLADEESSTTFTVDVENPSDAQVYKGLPFNVVINTKREYQKNAVAVSNITEDNESAKITKDTDNWHIDIANEAWTTAKDTEYSVPVTVSFDNFVEGYPLVLTPNTPEDVLVKIDNNEVSSIDVNQSSVTFTLVHTGQKLLEDTNGTISFDISPKDSDHVYADLPKTISISTTREKALSAYVSQFEVTNEIDNSGNAFTQITLPANGDEDVKLNYSILRKSDSTSGTFSEIANGSYNIKNGLTDTADNCDVLRVIPEYKVVLTKDSTEVETQVISHIHPLSVKQIALIVMESIRHGLIDEDLHKMGSGTNFGALDVNESIYNDTFKHHREYLTTPMAYIHTYTLSNYKPYMISISGDFKYTSDNNNKARAEIINSIDTVNHNWIAHEQAPFTGTIKFSSPYGDGSLTFNNVNIASNNWNSPSWKDGSITVNVGNKSETYSNSTQIPFGFYMDKNTFDQAIVGKGSDGKKKVYFSSFDSTSAPMYTYPLSTENNWAIEVNENVDSENSANKDYTATLQMHFDGVDSKHPLAASIKGSNSGLSVSNLRYSNVENGQQTIYFDVTIDSEASLDFENPGSGVTVTVTGDSDIYSNTSVPFEVVLHGSRIEKRIPVVLDSIAEQVDSDIVSITNTSANAYKIAIKDSSIDTAQSSTFEVPVVLNFPDVRNGFDIDVSVKENSNNNVVSNITSIEKGTVKLNLTHENAKEFETTLGIVTLVVNSEHTHIYEGLPLEITIDVERDRNLSSIYQNIFANSIKGKTYKYRGTVAGNSEILETYTVSADGKTITKTHTDWRDGKTSTVQTYTSSSARNQTTATYSNNAVTYNSDTSITIGDKTVTTDFSDPGPLFVDRVKGKTFKWRSTSAGSSEWLHTYSFDAQGKMKYTKTLWRGSTTTVTSSQVITTDSRTSAKYGSTSITFVDNNTVKINNIDYKTNFNDKGALFLDRVKGKTYKGDETYIFSADGKSFTMKGRRYYYEGVNHGNGYTTVEYGFKQDWGLIDVWWFSIVRIENNDVKISTGTKGAKNDVYDDAFRYNKAYLK